MDSVRVRSGRTRTGELLVLEISDEHVLVVAEHRRTEVPRDDRPVVVTTAFTRPIENVPAIRLPVGRVGGTTVRFASEHDRDKVLRLLANRSWPLRPRLAPLVVAAVLGAVALLATALSGERVAAVFALAVVGGAVLQIVRNVGAVRRATTALDPASG